MNINKTSAVALLVALGFAKATGWDDNKLKERLAQVPQKVNAEDVPEGHEDLYKKLAAKPADEGIEFEGAEPKKEKKAEKPAPAPEGKPERKSDGAKGKPEKSEKPKADAKPEKGEKPAKAEKPKGEKPAKADAKPAKKKIEFEKDAFGCRKGSISAKVNTVVSDKWQTEQEIADAASVSLDQARGRLYYGATDVQGVFEREKLIRYRLKPAKADQGKKKKTEK